MGVEGKQGKVILERMSGLHAWEFYRAADEETDKVVCKIALRFDDGADEVEYAVWREEEEPSVTGSIASTAYGWGDAEREGVLRQILEEYAEEMPEVKRGVEFDFGADEDDDDDDEDDDE